MNDTTTNLGAWHGREELRESTLAQLRDDLAKDRLIRGSYGNGDGRGSYRGCMIGCLVAGQLAAEHVAAGRVVTDALFNTFRGSWHDTAASRFNVPIEIADLWEYLFESVSYDTAPNFALRSTEAVQVGADLSQVVSRVIIDVIEDPECGLLRQVSPSTEADTEARAEARGALTDVLALYRRLAAGTSVLPREWHAARDRADQAYGNASTRSHSYSWEAECVAEWANAATCEERRTNSLFDDAQSLSGKSSADYVDWIAERLIHHTANAPLVAS